MKEHSIKSVRLTPTVKARLGKRLRDSILSPIFHSYIFAIYKNESLWI